MSQLAFQVEVTVSPSARDHWIEKLIWENLSFELLKKYDWYFTYRAALLQVKYPKMRVEKTHVRHRPSGATAEELYKRAVASRLGEVTKMKNRIQRYIDALKEKDPMGLFDLNEDPAYQKALIKLERKETELANIAKLSPDEYYKSIDAAK